MSDILNADPKQFRIQENGDVCFQPLLNNPLPGQKIATLSKGDSLYIPHITLCDSENTSKIDASALQSHLSSVVTQSITATLDPLIKLCDNADILPAPVQEITAKLSHNYGILPRATLEDLITQLDPEMRRILRARGVRLGPVLAFIPALGKPAAVRLRAMLYTLWHGKSLPAEVPRDGSVSQVIDPATIDNNYYLALGYPVYAKRAIRADMLDRLVCEIYESAKDGKFQAQHKMAEWLGCPIAELYEILEALGHRKAHDTADHAIEVTPTTITTTPEPEIRPALDQPETSTETSTDKTEPAPPEQPKRPELATFSLKRGKAAAPKQRVHTQRTDKDKKPHADTRTFASSRKGGKKDFKKSPPPKREHIAKAPDRSENDSPFAILKQLKGD